MPRWRRRWFMGGIQITLLWDDYTWAVGWWVNKHSLSVAIGYLFLDIC